MLNVKESRKEEYFCFLFNAFLNVLQLNKIILCWLRESYIDKHITFIDFNIVSFVFYCYYYI